MSSIRKSSTTFLLESIKQVGMCPVLYSDMFWWHHQRLPNYHQANADRQCIYLQDLRAAVSDTLRSEHHLQILMHSKLGGSISLRWVEYASMILQFTLSKLFNHSKVEVYNGHRCFVPAGCLSVIFGESSRVRNQWVLGGEATTLALQQPYTDHHIVHHIEADEEGESWWTRDGIDGELVSLRGQFIQI